MKITILGILLYASSVATAVTMVTACPLHKPPEEKVKVSHNDTLPVGGYLDSINTPTYTNNRTRRILNDFNELGSGQAVIWGDPVKSFFLNRKITIQETDICEHEKDGEVVHCVGISTCGVLECAIKVKTGLDALHYRQVLLHEYMHCMGYDDNSDEEDLMYHTENVAPEINIQYYAEMAAERQEIWKNLKSLSSNTKPTK